MVDDSYHVSKTDYEYYLNRKPVLSLNFKLQEKKQSRSFRNITKFCSNK